MRRSDPNITIVVPCYNEGENLPLLIEAIEESLAGQSFELIFVDDASTDESFKHYSSLAKEKRNVKYIRLVKNCGQQFALKAGIDHAKGDVIITMDADLQHPPSLILQMLKEWQNGAEIVEGVRTDYGKAFLLKRITSNLYYRFLGWLSRERVAPGVSDYRLIDKKVAGVLQRMNEQPLYLRGLFSWMGFPVTRIPYEIGMRKHGKTKYTIRKMITLAMAGVTGMSIKPLRLSLLAGIVISVFAFFYALYALYVSFFTPYTVEGWTSIIISILLLSGFQLIILGILGEYLGKLFMENKRRPGYIIACSNIEGINTT